LLCGLENKSDRWNNYEYNNDLKDKKIYMDLDLGGLGDTG
jgi:hypothetical protein